MLKKVESMFSKINTCLQETATCIGLQAEQIFSVNIQYAYFFNFQRGSFFSKQQHAFRKDYSTKYCLLSMLEKWKSAVDKGKYFGALLADLSRVFDCISHELILAKLHASYDFSLRVLRWVHSYLTNRIQRTRVNGDYSSWEEILFGVPQGSILGPLLFNIFLCDLFLIMKETSFASYAHDKTPYVTAENLTEVIKSLERRFH